MDTQKSTYLIKTTEWLWRAAITFLLMLIFCDVNHVLAQKNKRVPSINKKLSKSSLQTLRQQKKDTIATVEMFQPSSGTAKDTTISTYLPFQKGIHKVQVEKIGEHLVWQGDILLNKNDLAKSTVHNGTVEDRKEWSFRWPNGVIPYLLSDSHPQKNRIETAIAIVNEQTKLCIVPHTNEIDYVEFEIAQGCASHIGRVGGRQEIRVGASCQVGNIVHELFHAAGLFHEHSSPNRDEHVQILWDNIEIGKERNFRIESDGFAIGDYDFGSIMHYPAKAFGKIINGVRQTTIVCKGDTLACSHMGQRVAPSKNDIEAINLIYRNASGCGNTLEWKSLDGKLINAPIVLSSNEGQLDVFAQATDSSLYHRQQIDSDWKGWQKINGKLQFGSEVSALALDTGQIMLFARGVEDTLRYAIQEEKGWSRWKSLEIKVMGVPTVLHRDSALIDVFVQDMDSSIVHLQWNGSVWQSLEDLNGKFPVGTKVTAIAQGNHRIDLFAKGKEDMLFHKFWDGEKWQGWNVDKQQLTTMPTAVYRDSAQIDVFLRNEDGEVLHKLWSGNPRSGAWNNIGGKMPNDGVIQLVQQDSSRMVLFAKGVDNALWYAYGYGQDWSEWTNLGGDLKTNPSVILEGENQWKVFTRGRNDEVLYVEFSLEERLAQK